MREVPVMAGVDPHDLLELLDTLTPLMADAQDFARATGRTPDAIALDPNTLPTIPEQAMLAGLPVIRTTVTGLVYTPPTPKDSSCDTPSFPSQPSPSSRPDC